jgi:hypothetical protein
MCFDLYIVLFVVRFSQNGWCANTENIKHHVCCGIAHLTKWINVNGAIAVALHAEPADRGMMHAISLKGTVSQDFKTRFILRRKLLHRASIRRQ